MNTNPWDRIRTAAKKGRGAQLSAADIQEVAHFLEETTAFADYVGTIHLIAWTGSERGGHAGTAARPGTHPTGEPT
jgi:hypothetical protein